MSAEMGVSARNGRPIWTSETGLPRFTRLRLDRGYSCADIARELGRLGCPTSVNTVSNLERGVTGLSARRFVALARLFRCSLEDMAVVCHLQEPRREPVQRGAVLEI